MLNFFTGFVIVCSYVAVTFIISSLFEFYVMGYNSNTRQDFKYFYKIVRFNFANEKFVTTVRGLLLQLFVLICWLFGYGVSLLV